VKVARFSLLLMQRLGFLTGLVLSFTSTAGAALWASDMEQKRDPKKGATEIPIKEAHIEL
jgi:hypothetical protein